MPLSLPTAPGDTPLRRWARRAVTVPGFLLAFAVAATLYPLLLPAAAWSTPSGGAACRGAGR